MILPNVEAVLGLHAFAGDAGSDHFGEAITVERVHIERVFELARMALVQGSAPKLPSFNEERRGSSPWARNSSTRHKA